MKEQTKLFLAPMAGYTNLPFRLLAQENGADVTVSEMVSAKGLYYKDVKTKKLLETVARERAYGVQLFGSEPEILAESVEILTSLRDNERYHFEFLDFNIGCPAPKIVKNGDGSALLKNYPRLEKCIRAIKDHAGQIPVSVKTRIGFDEGEQNLIDISHIIEDNGADFFTVHPRTRSQFYSGSSNWEAVAEAVKQVNIPVILSGDITSPERAKQALEAGVSGLMIGRAALENPFIFTQIKQYLKTGTYDDLTLDQKINIINRHLDLSSQYLVGDRIVIELRKQLANYTKGLPGASQLRKKLFELTDVDEVKLLFENLRNK